MRSSTGRYPQKWGKKNPKRISPTLLHGVWWFYPCSYEVQLESRVRRRGLGKFLLQILQLVANR